MNLFNKLSLRYSDYVAVIGCNAKLTSAVSSTAKGIVCAEGERLQGLRHVKDTRNLDTSAFDKILYRWGNPKSNPLVDCIRACDHMGMVVMQGVPYSSKNGLVSYLERKGIYEWWFSQGKFGVGDLIFKVRKYPGI